MLGIVGLRSVGLLVAVALAATIGTARPARAGDLGKILAGAAVGYLVYKALDQDVTPQRARSPQYNPPRQAHHDRDAWNRGCWDAWGRKIDCRHQQQRWNRGPHYAKHKYYKHGSQRDYGPHHQRGWDQNRRRSGDRDHEQDRDQNRRRGQQQNRGRH